MINYGIAPIWFFLIFGLFPFNVEAQGLKKIEQEMELEIETEYRYFFKEAQFDGQASHFPSLAIKPGYSLEWNDGYESINFTGFFRLDRDESRTHWDIRELYYQKAGNNWELNIGLKKEFWGVSESIHLVDIINQTDQVESFDGEEKLGQPMLQFSWISDKLGTFEFYHLPYHRKRTFGGEKARLRFAQVIDEGDLAYESDAEEWHQDFAFRWKHYFGIFDIGLSHFYGTGREPYFAFDIEGQLATFYPIINQSGIDLQLTHNAFLWKIESIYRHSDAQEFLALAAGLEYTFSNVNGKGLDIGILTEYLFDERDELALSSMQNDLFIGSRFALNDEHDSSLLIGGIFDLDGGSKIFAIEASRRIGSSLKIELETRIFTGVKSEELLLSNFQDDSFLRFSLSTFF